MTFVAAASSSCVAWRDDPPDLIQRSMSTSRPPKMSSPAACPWSRGQLTSPLRISARSNPSTFNTPIGVSAPNVSPLKYHWNGSRDGGSSAGEGNIYTATCFAARRHVRHDRLPLGLTYVLVSSYGWPCGQWVFPRWRSEE